MTVDDIENLLRRAKPAAGHRHLPLSARAMRELDALEVQARVAARQPQAMRRQGTLRFVVLGAAATLAAVIMVGGVNVHVQSASAVTDLHSAAYNAIQFSGELPATGQFVKSTVQSRTLSEDSGGQQTDTVHVYMPADPRTDWVLVNSSGIRRAINGSFYGGSWLSESLADIPTGDAQQVLDYFDSKYQGGSASRDEDNFVRITDLLASGLVPASIRARLFDALALIPGVTSTPDVNNLDGQAGIAIGRTEALRGGLRHEIIIELSTGLVIGERTIHTVAMFGFGINDVRVLTSIHTSVVSSAP